MADVTVTLRNKKISVDKQSVPVSVEKSEKVSWTSTDGPFNIEFKPGSHWPNPNTKQVGSSWVAECGPFNNPHTKLQYNITASEYDTLDPEIDIRP
ncbi:MAG TPA: hypothetical protein VJZ76_13920 [Thermoanaerobaculia bacterium]|nr:hypothetical protein [Thermoanaerobaculia bacterium]